MMQFNAAALRHTDPILTVNLATAFAQNATTPEFDRDLLFLAGLLFYGARHATDAEAFILTATDGMAPVDALALGTAIGNLRDEMLTDEELFVADPEAEETARVDALLDLLAGMRGRTFGLTYVKLSGEIRTMLAQVERIGADYVTVREVNLTKRMREDAEAAGSDPAGLTAYRTAKFDGILQIRVGGETFDFS